MSKSELNRNIESLCVENNLDGINALIKKNNTSGIYCILENAITYDCLDVVKALTRYIDIKSEEFQEEVSGYLGLACSLGHLNIIKYLIEDCYLDLKNKKQLNRRDEETGFRCLEEACDRGHLDVIKYLLDRGCKIHEEHIRDLNEKYHHYIIRYLNLKGIKPIVSPLSDEE